MITFESSVGYVWGGLNDVRIWVIYRAYEISKLIDPVQCFALLGYPSEYVGI